MNCDAGTQAVIIVSEVDNVGQKVICIEQVGKLKDREGDDYWMVLCHTPLPAKFRDGKIRKGKYAFVRDRNLWPADEVEGLLDV